MRPIIFYFRCRHCRSTLSRVSLTKAHVLWWCDNKLIWFDFQWAAWLWLFALFFTQLFNIYRFFILLFCWSAYFVHITIVSSFCLNGLKSFSLFSFSCFWFACCSFLILLNFNLFLWFVSLFKLTLFHYFVSYPCFFLKTVTCHCFLLFVVSFLLYIFICL